METQIPRFFKLPEESCFVFGPRGTGKTTFLRKNFPGALWIDLLEPEIFRSLSARPERLVELTSSNPKQTVVIDEIQKFYFFDTGVFRSLRPAGPLDKPEEIEGAALEGLVYQHLAAWNSYGGDENRLHYWRTSSGSEVDFVLYGPDVFAAIEVKNSG